MIPTFLLARCHSWYRLDLSFIATCLCPAAVAVSWVEACLQRKTMTRRVTARQRQCELNVSPVYILLLYVRVVVSCVIELNAMICHRLTNGFTLHSAAAHAWGHSARHGFLMPALDEVTPRHVTACSCPHDCAYCGRFFTMCGCRVICTSRRMRRGASGL